MESLPWTRRSIDEVELIDNTVAHPVPDPVPRRVGPNRLKSAVRSMSNARTMFTNSRSSPSLRSHQASRDGMPKQMSQAGAMEAGQLVGDDDGAAGPGHAAHFAQGRLVVGEIVKSADGPAGVEGRIVEREVFGLGPGESPRRRRMPAQARLELSSRDVDAMNGPSRRQEAAGSRRCRFPTSSTTACRCSSPIDMAEDLHPGPANSPLDHQEGLFPWPEPDPAGTVVEIGDDSIAAGERPDRFHDPVAHG